MIRFSALFLISGLFIACTEIEELQPQNPNEEERRQSHGKGNFKFSAIPC